MATNRHFGKDQSAAVMGDAETPMEVENLPVPHVDGAAAASIAATTADALMHQEREEEEEMPFTDDELAVCFKVSMHAYQCLHTHVHCGMQWWPSTDASGAYTHVLFAT